MPASESRKTTSSRRCTGDCDTKDGATPRSAARPRQAGQRKECRIITVKSTPIEKEIPGRRLKREEVDTPPVPGVAADPIFAGDCFKS